ncbi:hypothetical protein J6590_086889 [Homalodisca vitripennis]|nr:hypothetical protein J6590_086889 [Homalodisca vitripennis]
MVAPRLYGSPPDETAAIAFYLDDSIFEELFILLIHRSNRSRGVLREAVRLRTSIVLNLLKVLRIVEQYPFTHTAVLIGLDLGSQTPHLSSSQSIENTTKRRADTTSARILRTSAVVNLSTTLRIAEQYPFTYTAVLIGHDLGSHTPHLGSCQSIDNNTNRRVDTTSARILRTSAVVNLSTTIRIAEQYPFTYTAVLIGHDLGSHTPHLGSCQSIDNNTNRRAVSIHIYCSTHRTRPRLAYSAPRQLSIYRQQYESQSSIHSHVTLCGTPSHLNVVYKYEVSGSGGADHTAGRTEPSKDG